MLGVERLLCPLRQSDGGDGGPQLLWRRWGETEKMRFFIFLWAALTVAMTKIPAMLLSVTFEGIQTAVDLLSPAVPPKMGFFL